MGKNEFKICSGCGISKPINDFGVDKKNNDGLKNRCKICKNKQTRESRAKNKEKLRIYNAKYIVRKKKEAEKKIDQFSENFLEWLG